ncbi:MAG: hypothetical protein HYR55_08835 [Acidobacteria bacterium]|nr:hypothetical protein [Acidobacteriota bacterium]MBI3655797.1 hypothetical protein [Acidobacteriota bacterium]
MLRRLAFALMLSLVASLTVFSQIVPQTVFPFPQIAIGQMGDGNEFRTQVILTNPSEREAFGTMDFLDDEGRDITLWVRSLRTGELRRVTGVLPFRIKSGVTTVWELSSADSVRSGSSIVSTDYRDGGNGVRISGTAAYGIFDERGNILSLAGVGASGFITDAFVPILDDSSRAMNTGIAFTTVLPTTIFFSLLDDNGNTLATAQASYRDGIHRALFYNEIFGRPPYSRLTIRSVRIISNNPIATIAIQMAGNTLTSLPVVAIAGVSYKAGDAPLDLGGILRRRHSTMDLSAAPMP